MPTNESQSQVALTNKIVCIRRGGTMNTLRFSCLIKNYNFPYRKTWIMGECTRACACISNCNAHDDVRCVRKSKKKKKNNLETTVTSLRRDATTFPCRQSRCRSFIFKSVSSVRVSVSFGFFFSISCSNQSLNGRQWLRCQPQEYGIIAQHAPVLVSMKQLIKLITCVVRSFARR